MSAALASIPAAALAVQSYPHALWDWPGNDAANTYIDISSVAITNNASTIFFQINLNPGTTADPNIAGSVANPVNILTNSNQVWGLYEIEMETSAGGGSTAIMNPYSAPIGISTGMNYWVSAYTSAGTGTNGVGADGSDIYQYSSGAWNRLPVGTGYSTGPYPTETATSLLIPYSLSTLGLSTGSNFNFDVVTTFGQPGGQGVYDALDSTATNAASNTPWNSTPWDSATATGSTYSTTTYTVINPAFTWNNFPASVGGDGVTWDVGTPSTNSADYNWNNGIQADQYTDGSDITFNDVNSGNYAVTLNTTVSPHSVTVNNSAGNYTISGTGTIAGTGSLTKMGSDTLTLSTVNTYSGGTIVNAGMLVVGVHGALPDHSLTITGGAVQLAANTGLAQLTSLSISSGAVLDLTNNHLFINYGAGPDPVAAIRTYLINGRNGGTWSGTGGIDSSTAALPANSAYGVGYADSADPGNPAGLATHQIEIKYTLLGDATLTGTVTGTDFTILATNLGKSVSGWDQGDFLYTGTVTGSDFTALVTNLGKTASGADLALPAADWAAVDAFAAANGLMADVPEPATTSLLALGAIGMLARRRRQSS
ncbi:MAG: autotransporter-associated beta strand repeat-containing protein [Tepidisphaeraceae bacterium]